MSEENEVPIVVVKKSSGVTGFLLGLLCGAAAGILFAPRSGEETQRELREGALRLRSDAEGRLEGLREDLAGIYERAREDVTERVDLAREEIRHRRRQAEEAVRAGRSVARGAREDLERRVEESKRAYRDTIKSREHAAGTPEEDGGAAEDASGDEA